MPSTRITRSNSPSGHYRLIGFACLEPHDMDIGFSRIDLSPIQSRRRVVRYPTSYTIRAYPKNPVGPASQPVGASVNQLLG